MSKFPGAMAAILIVFSLFSTSALGGWPFGLGGERGSGHIINRTRDVSDFTRIKTNGAIDLEITVGEKKSLVIRFDDNLIDRIRTEVHGHKLTISSRGSFSAHRSCRVIISVPELEAVSSKGSGDISIRSLHGKRFDFELSGSGDLKAEGAVEKLSVEIRGSGDVDARRLKARDCRVSIMGSGDASVFASDRLKAQVFGSGDVDFYGAPLKVSRSVHGSGSIRRH